MASNKNTSNQSFDVNSAIGQWRAFLQQHDSLSADDIDELEDHLRNQSEALENAGLDEEESFIIAIKRLGSLNAISGQFASIYSGRLWKSLTTPNKANRRSQVFSPSLPFSQDFLMAFLLAICAGIAIKIPALFGLTFIDGNAEWLYMRNISFFSLPLLGYYFIWKHEQTIDNWRLPATGMIIALGAANVYSFPDNAATLMLMIMHLPIVMWFLIGVLYTGDRWRSESRRMDFIRFSGEYLIYFVLIALGGGVLTGFTLGMFSFIGFDLEWAVGGWIVPCGAMGASIIAAWLVESKQSAVENMAPVLARIFTPLFTLSLLAFLATMLVTGQGFQVDREVLIGLDLILVLVLALVLYAVSSRDTVAEPGIFDKLQFLLVISALLVDLLALTAISGRIFDMGFTPNRVAALGENLVLLVSLSGYAWLYWQFLNRRIGFARLEKWQTDYVPAYAIWAAVVVLLFPLSFGFS